MPDSQLLAPTFARCKDALAYWILFLLSQLFHRPLVLQLCIFTDHVKRIRRTGGTEDYAACLASPEAARRLRPLSR